MWRKLKGLHDETKYKETFFLIIDRYLVCLAEELFPRGMLLFILIVVASRDPDLSS